MPLFSYVCVNADKKTVTGTLEAPSVQGARATLRQMDLDILTLRVSDGPAPGAPVRSPMQEAESPVAFRAVASAPAWVDSDLPREPESQPLFVSPAREKQSKHGARAYFPLIDTFRLYAGWLLVWYGCIFAVGSYQFTRSLPVRIGFMDGLFQSQLVLHFSLAAFLFLLLTAVHKQWGGGMGKGGILLAAGLVLFGVFVRNI